MKVFYQLLACIQVLSLSLSLSSKGQTPVSQYIYYTTNEAFIPLQNDTTLGEGFQDDVLYMSATQSIIGNTASLSGVGMPIGFTFNFGGLNFNRWAFSSNGYIKLGNGSFTIKNSLASAFSSPADSSVQTNIIAGLHEDIMMTTTQGRFSYKITGSPGSRILVVQYAGMKHWDVVVTSEEIYNFQIRLHEGSNRISFVYGDFLKDEKDRAYTVGIKGAQFRNYHIRTLPDGATNWNQNVKSTANNLRMPINLGIKPNLNSCFNFIPKRFDDDLSMDQILRPIAGQQNCRMGSAETVEITVRNSGINPQTSAVVGFKTSTGQTHTETVTFSPALESLDSRTITLATGANLSGIKPPSLKCFVILPGEEEGARNNDSLASVFSVGRPFWESSINSYDSLVNQRLWTRARGANGPTDGFSLWRQANEFGTFSTAVLMPADSLPTRNEWLVSPGYRVDTTFNYSFSFQAAVTKGLLGIKPAPTIGDDTIKLMYSTDCRQSWKTLRVFNQSDLASGVINNQMKPFQIPLPASVKEVVHFALFAKSTASNTLDTTYRFHFRRLELKRVARFDLSGDTVRVPSVISLTCRYSSQEPVHLRITNRGFEPMDSARAGYSINGGLPVFKTFTFSPPLGAGQSRTLIFDGTFGADVSFPQSYVILGFTNLALENASLKANDTARRVFQTLSPYSIPSPVYTTFTTLLASRWQRGRGQLAPAGTSSSWSAKNLNAENTTGLDFNVATASLQDWIYSASYEGPTLVKFAFKAAVTVVGGTLPAASMNQDTVKLVYSIDCGASWKTARSFTSSDLTSNVLTNRLKEIILDLENPKGALLVGFFAKRKTGTNPTTAFTFHIDSIAFNTPSFSDVGSVGIVLGSSGAITCSGPNPVPLSVIVKNLGSTAVTSSLIGYRNNGVSFSKNVNFSPALAVGKSDTILFTGTEAPVFSSAGNYALFGFTNLSGEGANTRFNDTSSIISYTILPKISVPYNQAFNLPTSLPVGWLSDTASGKAFKIVAGRGPMGSNVLSFRSQGAFNRAQVITRNYGPITASANYLNLFYRSQEQTGAFFRLRPTDFIEVLVSTNCGSSYAPLGRIDSLNQQVAAGFLYKSFNLDAFIGQDLTFMIDAKSTPKPFSSNYVDISLVGIDGFLSAEQLISDPDLSFQLYPNPSDKGFVVISAIPQEGTWQVFNQKGQLLNLDLQIISEQEQKIMTAGLARGIYILKVTSPKKQWIRKFSIE